MHRAILLTLLAIPTLVIMHIALFWQPVPWDSEMFWAVSQTGAQSRGHWQSPDQAVASHFTVDRTPEQGS